FTVALFTELITARHRLGRHQDGLDACSQSDELGIVHSGVEFARGYCRLHLKSYREAERAFRGAIQLGSEPTPYARTGDAGLSTYKARYGLALALVGQDRYIEAARECEAALSDQPGFVEARYLLSVCCRRLDQTEQARNELETLLLAVPHHVEAR